MELNTVKNGKIQPMIFRELKMVGNELVNYEFLGSEDEKNLKKLSKINIFVGQNNSGKSRLLRGISKIEELEFIPKNVDYDEINDFVKNSVETIANTLSTHRSSTLGTLQSTLIPAVQPGTFFKQNDNSLYKLSDLFQYITTQDLPRLQQNGQNMQECFQTLEIFVGENMEKLDSYINDIGGREEGEYKRMYIPILRGLRPPRKDSQNENDFQKRTNLDYYNNSAGEDGKFKNNEIFTGLELYENIRKRLLGSQAERQLVRDFETFLSENFFDNKPITLIPAHDADVLTVSIGDIEKKIFDLGDGIQSLIILNYPIFEFVRKNPEDSLLVFIEEPELYIHPGLQRKLLERWEQSDYNKVQFFVTTHSNHFLDMTIDFSNISIFKVALSGVNAHKENTFSIENLSSGDRNLLETLGVRNSSVFLSNSTIWVEGISDRIYLRRYLELYLEKINKSEVYKEDYHYSFVEYGGGNLPHWSFDSESSNDEAIRTASIVSNVFLVADRDDTHTKKQSLKARRLKKLKALLGKKNIHITQAREIENIVSWDILKKTILARGDSIKERLNSEKIAEKMIDSPLGELIHNRILEGNPKRKYKPSESKTIADKPRFAKEVCAQIGSFDELSVEAKQLTKALYRFIGRTNQ